MRTIEGDFFANIMIAGDTDANASQMRVKLTLRKWDGSTETDILEITSDAEGLTTVQESNIVALSGQVPLTNIAPGEFLRCTIEVQTAGIGQVVAGNVQLGHDPFNRADPLFPTTLNDRVDSNIIIPFKVVQ